VGVFAKTPLKGQDPPLRGLFRLFGRTLGLQFCCLKTFPCRVFYGPFMFCAFLLPPPFGQGDLTRPQSPLRTSNRPRFALPLCTGLCISPLPKIRHSQGGTLRGIFFNRWEPLRFVSPPPFGVAGLFFQPSAGPLGLFFLVWPCPLEVGGGLVHLETKKMSSLLSFFSIPPRPILGPSCWF